MTPSTDLLSSPPPWSPGPSMLSEPGLPSAPGADSPLPGASGRLLDLRNDLVFKLLFTRAPHLLADLINAVRHDETPIVVERILNPQIDAADLDGKTIVLDLHARDATGQLYNVEMQVRRYERWPARSAYYLARTLSEQIQRGQDYELLKPAIAIHFLAHDLFDDPGQADWRFELRDRRQPAIRLGQELQLHIIELPKADRLGCLPAALSAWVACFQHGWEEASMKDITHEPVREAVGRLKVLTMDEDARWRAYAREKAIADNAAALAYATRTGVEQGLEQGRRQGESALLERLLARRFGPLPDATAQRLRDASDAELETWAVKLLDATTLEEVFGP